MPTDRFSPAPGADPTFDSMMEAVHKVLDDDPAGKDISAEVRRETLARALVKHGGKTFVPKPPEDETLLINPFPDQKPVPRVLAIPAQPAEPYWWSNPEQSKVIEHFILMRRALGTAFHGGLLIAGGSGYGKTLMLPHLIERMNEERGLDLRMFKMDCAVTTDAQKWFGRREISKAGSRYETSDFIRAVESGTVVQLDELNRIHPHVSDSVHALLDGTQTVSLSDLNMTVTVHPMTVFIATMNVGSQYGGTYRLDHAFRSRFGTTLEVGPPPRDEEIKIVHRNTGCDMDAASNLVDIADKSRQMFETGDLRTEISTRELVAAGHWVKAGMTEREALLITAIPMFDGDTNGTSVGQESDRSKIMAVIDGRLGR